MITGRQNVTWTERKFRVSERIALNIGDRLDDVSDEVNSGGKDPDAGFWKFAKKWVDENSHRIFGRTRKFIAYSPYDFTDFHQQAYVSAFEAARTSHRKGEPEMFERYFWMTFKSHSSDMATDPAVRDLMPHFKNKAPYRPARYLEESDGHDLPTRVGNHMSPEKALLAEDVENADYLRRKQLRDIGFKHMRPREATVWGYLLTNHEHGRKTSAELAHDIMGGISRQAFEKIRNRGLVRLNKALQGKEPRTTRSKQLQQMMLEYSK